MKIKIISAAVSAAFITKTSSVAILGAVPLSLFIPMSAQAATSSIEQITIYQGLASVTRTLPMDGNGEQTVVFSCLSPYLDQDSLSVQAPSNVNLGEVSIQTLSGEPATQCANQGDAKVQAARDNLAAINADLEAAQLAKAYLQNTTKVTQLNIDGTLANNARNLETQAAMLNKKILAIKQQQARAQDALTQLMAGSASVNRNTVTQVSVRTASRTPSMLKLHYQVRGASWQPTYQARLNTDTKQLNITASAIIAQQTGENWLNVPLTLSSVNPNKKASGQLPNVSRLSLYDEQQDKIARYARPVMEAAPMVVSADSSDAIENRAPLPSFVVSQQDKNGITEYRLSQRVSIPSDGRRVRTVIDEQVGNSKLWIRSTPSRELTGYWYASAPFLTPAWVDGSMQLYRDDNYIGQTRYNYQRLKEQGIGFGTDTNMLVKQLVNKDKKGDKGAFNRLQTVTKTEAYQFTNKHDNTVNLQVLGSESISRDDDLTVSVTHTPPVTVRDWNSNQGVVAWEFDLAPQQSQVVQSTSQVSYPANKELVGQ